VKSTLSAVPDPPAAAPPVPAPAVSAPAEPGVARETPPIRPA